jgi:hypothetical protein
MSSLSPKSPNFWVLVSSILGVAGLIASGAGWVTHVPWLTTVGLALLAPIIFGGIVLLVIVIPFLIVANRRRRQNGPQARDDT